MANFNKKTVTFYLVLSLVVLSLSTLVSPLKEPALIILKLPLTVLSLIDREINGIIFYHRNYAQNEQLRNEIALLRQKINNSNEVYLENSRLKNLVALKKDTPYKVIVSKVIARSPDNWTSVVIIDKGRHHGINKGSVVLSYLGLAGKVIEAQNFTSKVMLVNDPNLAVSCIDQRSRQEGLISGTLGNSLTMRYLPRDADVSVEDVIVTSGLTENYPKGLLVGKIVSVGEEFSGLSRYAIIKPCVNLYNIEEVLVIIP